MRNLSDTLLTIDLPGQKPVKSGKVREIFDLGQTLLIVASDRISAFDYIMPNGIPDKGRILTQISLFWFDFTRSIIENHLISAELADFPGSLKTFPQLAKRSMLVKKTKVIPVECVVRGYLSGSGWKDYQQTGSICGIKLPAGLKESDKLPEPIFTPTTKADEGHDLPINENQMKNVIVKFVETQNIASPPDTIAKSIKSASLVIYQKCAEYALTQGIIIADTKFEFGIIDDSSRDAPSARLLLIDEILTPDSSRFWPAKQYKPGGAQPSYDKQYLRDYLESIHWNKQPPAPQLPEEVVKKTREKYLEAYKQLTGKTSL